MGLWPEKDWDADWTDRQHYVCVDELSSFGQFKGEIRHDQLKDALSET